VQRKALPVGALELEQEKCEPWANTAAKGQRWAKKSSDFNQEDHHQLF
jgi:hypothetical protein